MFTLYTDLKKEHLLVLVNTSLISDYNPCNGLRQKYSVLALI